MQVGSFLALLLAVALVAGQGAFIASEWWLALWAYSNPAEQGDPRWVRRATANMWGVKDWLMAVSEWDRLQIRRQRFVFCCLCVDPIIVQGSTGGRVLCAISLAVFKF